jgi:aryl-alcohol dehydrogenase
MKITAAVVEAKGAPFALRELELGELADDEILVEVAASGICHTDLICRDQWIPTPLPAVLGHEGAGVVRAVGGSVTGVTAGDHVAMSYDSCGSCPCCRKGLGVYCHRFFEHNFAASRPADGTSCCGAVHAHFFGQSSFATHSVARERNVVKLGADVPLHVVAPFGCGIQTGAGAILNVLKPEPGSTVAVFGAGAVGIAAMLAALVAGAERVILVDLRAARLDVARELGATHTIDASEQDPAAVIQSLGGAETTLEATGSPAAVRAAVDSLVPTGVCGVVGAPAFGTEVSLDVTHLMTGGRVVRGIVEGDSVPGEFIPRLVELWSAGSFPIDRVMRHYDFDQIEIAAHDAETGAVIKPVLRMH